MNKTILILALSSLTATSVIGAENTWEGFYGQVGIGYDSVKVSDSGGKTSGGDTFTRSFSDASGFIGDAGLGYNFKIGNDYLLGVGAEYYSESSSSSLNFSIPIYSVTGSGSYKLQDRYSFFVTPGMVVNKKDLIYAKLGYESFKVSNKVTASGSSVSVSSSRTSDGYLFGIGYKTFVQDKTYAFIEANYLKGNNKTNSSTSSDGSGTFISTTSSDSYNFLVGVGYKF